MILSTMRQKQPLEVFYKKGILSNSEGLQLYVKKTLHHRCFPVNFEKFLRSPILKNICERLLPREN